MKEIGVIDLKYVSSNTFKDVMYDTVHKIKKIKLKEKRKPWNGVKHRNPEKEFRSRKL